MIRHPKTKALSVRFTSEERAQLEIQAGRLSLGEYIRRQLLSGKTSKHRKHLPTPPLAKKMLAQVLAMLGQSRLAESMRGLAEAARFGTLPL